MSKKEPENPRENTCSHVPRGEHGKWVRGGPSPNPGGRPKSLKDMQELARKYTKRSIKRLAEIVSSKVDDRASTMAAKELLDRGWGKPAQPLTGEDGGPIQVQTLATLLAIEDDSGDPKP